MKRAGMWIGAGALCGAVLFAGLATAESSRPAAQRWQAVTGTVQTAPDGRNFVILSQRDGRFTVNATGARTRRLGRTVDFSEVRAGRVVTAFGSRSGSSIRAEEVCICPTTPRPGRVAGYRSTNLAITGTVTGMSGRTFNVLSRRDGRFTVDASDASFRRYGDPATMEAVQRGLVVRAWGSTTGNARTIQAQEVCICPGSPEDGAAEDAEAGK